MIAQFLNIDLVKELGLDKLPEAERTNILNQMTEVLEGRISSEVFSLLSEGDKVALGQLIDTNGDVGTFLRNKIENFDLIIAEITANFKKEVLELHSVAVGNN